MLKLANFSIQVGGRTLFSIPDLQLERRIYGLIGPSLSGKSLFLKALSGVYPYSGTLNKVSCSLMFQENALFDGLNVAENVAFPLRMKKQIAGMQESKLHRLSLQERVEEALKAVDMLTSMHKSIDSLSGGMKKRVAFARCLIDQKDGYLIDDPTSGLDPLTSGKIMEVIKAEITSEQFAIIASHDLRRLFPVCHELLAIYEGQLLLLRKEDVNDYPELARFVRARYDFGQELG